MCCYYHMLCFALMFAVVWSCLVAFLMCCYYHIFCSALTFAVVLFIVACVCDVDTCERSWASSRACLFHACTHVHENTRSEFHVQKHWLKVRGNVLIDILGETVSLSLTHPVMFKKFVQTFIASCVPRIRTAARSRVETQTCDLAEFRNLRQFNDRKQFVISLISTIPCEQLQNPHHGTRSTKFVILQNHDL